MNILFVDFETYYDRDFNLKDADSSAEYVMTTPIQLMGWALNNEPIQMAVGEEETKRVLSSIDWATTALVSHNIRFDGRLVHQRFGHNPVMYFDTMGFMAALRYDVVFGGLKLSHLAKILQGEGVAVLDKGEEVKEAKGKHLYQYPNGQYYLAAKEVSQDFIHTLNLTKSGKTKTGKAFKDPKVFVAETISLFERFKEYCANDVDICRKGFYFMVSKLPRAELAYQDMIARCALYSQLVMDLPMLKAAKHKAETSLRDAVRGVADDWFDGDYAEAKAHLLSTGKLAILFKFMGGMTQDEVDDYIRTEGFDPEPPFIIPTKVSEKKSAKMGYTVYDYALAKKDDDMVKLSQLDYEPLQKVLAARKMAVYVNNYELPRLNRFINEQEAFGSVCMPLKVSGASTHRLRRKSKAETFLTFRIYQAVAMMDKMQQCVSQLWHLQGEWWWRRIARRLSVECLTTLLMQSVVLTSSDVGLTHTVRQLVRCMGVTLLNLTIVVKQVTKKPHYCVNEAKRGDSV